MPEMFHFQHPLWLLALLPLALLVWWIGDPASRDGAWQRICDARLLPYLLINQPHARHRLPVWLLAAGWLVTVVALADPVWEKQPQPVFRSEAARVVVLDLSRSMAAPDLAPSRLERARYKVEDVLRRSQEGQVGLVVFAGDAFVVSPLTNDAKTITELLQALEPGLMPVQGSRADLGLRKAGDLLKQAGVARGQILLVTDGDEGRAIDAARDLRRQGYTVSVLGVGTKQGAPLPDGKGGYVHDDAGAIVVPRLDVASLRALAAAGGGRYATITGNDADLDALLTPMAPRLDTKVKQSGLKTDVWVSRGPWLVVLLLPLAALAFRRGWLLVLVLLVAGTVSVPGPAMAASWNDLWVRPDQQAAQALAGGDNARAAELATDPSQRGTAEYRAGHYEQALKDFSRASGTDAEYNRGNALARLGHYKEALAAYDKALAAQPGMEDALHNKASVEALLRQQKKKQQQQQQQGSQKGKQQGKQGSQQHQQTGKNGSQHDQPQGKQGSSQGRQQGKQSSASPSPSAQTNGKGGEAATRQEAHGASPKADKGKKDSSTQSAQAGESRANKAKQQASADARRGGRQNTVDNTQPAGQGGDEQNTDKNPAADSEITGPGAGAFRKKAAASQPATESKADGETAKKPEPPGAPAAADTQTSEEQQAMEQWLRRIPDDPGGLLRRKFLYQYRQRAAATGRSDSQSW